MTSTAFIKDLKKQSFSESSESRAASYGNNRVILKGMNEKEEEKYTHKAIPTMKIKEG